MFNFDDNGKSYSSGTSLFSKIVQSSPLQSAMLLFGALLLFTVLFEAETGTDMITSDQTEETYVHVTEALKPIYDHEIYEAYSFIAETLNERYECGIEESGFNIPTSGEANAEGSLNATHCNITVNINPSIEILAKMITLYHSASNSQMQHMPYDILVGQEGAVFDNTYGAEQIGMSRYQSVNSNDFISEVGTLSDKEVINVPHNEYFYGFENLETEEVTEVTREAGCELDEDGNETEECWEEETTTYTTVTGNLNIDIFPDFNNVRREELDRYLEWVENRAISEDINTNKVYSDYFTNVNHVYENMIDLLNLREEFTLAMMRSGSGIYGVSFYTINGVRPTNAGAVNAPAISGPLTCAQFANRWFMSIYPFAHNGHGNGNEFAINVVSSYPDSFEYGTGPKSGGVVSTMHNGIAGLDSYGHVVVIDYAEYDEGGNLITVTYSEGGVGPNFNSVSQWKTVDGNTFLNSYGHGVFANPK